MTNLLTWKSSIFSRTYRIYEKEELIGHLTNQPVSYKANGEIDGKKYFFNTKGFFKQRVEIIDPETNQPIGDIEFGLLHTSAKIRIKDKTVLWKYDNLLNTKWSIKDAQAGSLHFSGSSTKGKIEGINPNRLLILSGLFVTNYFWHMGALIIAIALLPMLIK